MAQAFTDNRRCEDKGPHPIIQRLSPCVDTSSLFITIPLFLLFISLRIRLGPSVPFPLYFPLLSHPFSICLALSLPSTPTLPLFSSSSAPPPLFPCLLQQKSQRRHQRVCVCTCVCCYARSTSERAPHDHEPRRRWRCSCFFGESTACMSKRSHENIDC